MKYKDIPDRPILEFIDSRGGQWCTWFNLPYADNSVCHAMPDGFALAGKLVLAKMKQLIKRGLVEGCGCGCRGDFVLTDKGRHYLINDERGA